MGLLHVVEMEVSLLEAFWKGEEGLGPFDGFALLGRRKGCDGDMTAVGRWDLVVRDWLMVRD